MSDIELTYLSMDSLAEGIGASQVLTYVERIAAQGVAVRLHSFEKAPAGPGLAERLERAGVAWTPHAFGGLGPRAGLGRVVRAAAAVRRAPLLHARSDLAAAAALLARPRGWIWDMRSFWSDELIEMGRLRAGSPEERVMRLVERQSARQAGAIITLAAAAIPVLDERHGPAAGAKAIVITTCVDLTRFEVTPLPDGPLTLCLLGSVNRAYDVPAVAAFVAAAKRRSETRFTVFSPASSPAEPGLAALTDVRRALAFDEVPGALVGCHAGLSMWRPEMGVTLKGAMPTKIGEFLAAGRPVVVNPGLGDMDAIVAEHRCGVVLAATDEASIERALDELVELLADPALSGRCRRAAEAHFDVDRGVDALVATYRSLSG